MLISICLTLESDQAATLPTHLGRANYALVLERLRQIDPALAQSIHEGDGPKPVTCSDLLGARSNRQGSHIEAGQPYAVRVTGLTGPASQALAAGLLSETPQEWRVNDHPFRVTGATADPTEHSWAGQSSYESLAAHQMLQGRRPSPQVTLSFASPTAFKSGNVQMPLPLADLVFGSLVERWNAFSPVLLSPEMRRFGAEMIAISRYKLQSRPVGHKNQSLRIGGEGDVTYRALTSDRYWLGSLQMLADFALYSGVGVQTTTGMGQVRRTG